MSIATGGLAELQDHVLRQKETWIRHLIQHRLPGIFQIDRLRMQEGIAGGWSKTELFIDGVNVGWVQWRLDMEAGKLVMQTGPGETW